MSRSQKRNVMSCHRSIDTVDSQLDNLVSNDRLPSAGVTPRLHQWDADRRMNAAQGSRPQGVCVDEYPYWADLG
jgi:hypothetical protein